jgi:hypothetical protein
MIPAAAAAPVPPLPPVALARLLLVEGNTPLHFFEALLRHLQLAYAVEVRSFGSISTLKPFLVDLAANAAFQAFVTSLGVVRDAENDAGAARQSVDGALQAAGLTPARVPPIKTAVFILPDNSNPGMIETLCMLAVMSEPTLLTENTCTAQYFACLQNNGVALPAEPKLAKNRAQAYLASRLDVQLFPGQAAYRGHWPWNNAVFDPLKQFLQNL